MDEVMVPELADLETETGEGRTVLVLAHGRVRSVPLGLLLAPAWIETDARFDWSLPQAGETEVELLRHVAVLLDRVCPALTCYVVPGLRRPCGRPIGGLQHQDGALLLAVQAGTSPRWIWHTALHEAWHAVESRLTRADFDLVRQAVRHGMHMPADGYHDSTSERAADAFGAWACARLSVCPCPAAPGWSAERSMEQVFGEVLAGVYGTKAAARPSTLRLVCGDLWWLACQPARLLGVKKEVVTCAHS